MNIFSALKYGIISLYQYHSKNKQFVKVDADLVFDQSEIMAKNGRQNPDYKISADLVFDRSEIMAENGQHNPDYKISADLVYDESETMAKNEQQDPDYKISAQLGFLKPQMPQEALYPETVSYINPQAIEIESSLRNPSKAKKFRDTSNLKILTEDSDLSQNTTPNAASPQNEDSSVESSPKSVNQNLTASPYKPSYSPQSLANSIDMSDESNKDQSPKKINPQPHAKTSTATQEQPQNLDINIETFTPNTPRNLMAHDNENWQIFPSPAALKEQPAQTSAPEISDSPTILLERFTQTLARNEDISQIFIQNRQLFNLLNTQYEEIQEIQDQESLKNFLLTKKTILEDNSNDQIFDEAIKRITTNQQRSKNLDLLRKGHQTIEERLATMSLKNKPDLMIETQTQENANTNRKLDEQAITQQIQRFTTQLNGLKTNHSSEQFTAFLHENSQLFINLNIDQDIRHIEELDALKNLLKFKASQDDEQEQQQKHLIFLVNIIEQHQQQNSTLNNSSQTLNSKAPNLVKINLPKDPDIIPQHRKPRPQQPPTPENLVAQTRKMFAKQNREAAAKWRKKQLTPSALDPDPSRRQQSKIIPYPIESLKQDEKRKEIIKQLFSEQAEPQSSIQPIKSDLENGAEALSRSADFLSGSPTR